ncbi:MAG: LemA family protein [Elusimicrobiota bacterium]
MASIGLIIVAVVAVAGIAYFIGIYNGLVEVKNNIDKAWGNIDVLLKQRHDEIPKLIKTCEAYMQYEKSTLTEVIALRNAASSARTVGEKAIKEGELTASLGRLFALSENYPDLKAQTNFQNFQKRVSELESDIADRREFYNESVNNYNIRIQSFPDSLVANNMNLQPREMFKVTEAERKDVDVSFKVP